MGNNGQYVKRQSIIYGLTVILFFLISHVLIKQVCFLKILLRIADIEFWKSYFDPIFYTVFAVAFLVTQHKGLFECFKDYRENYKEYLYHIVVSFSIVIMLIIVAAIILGSLGIGDNSNETAVSEAVKASPVIEGVTALLIGPFVEEMVFRGFIYEIIRIKIKDNQKNMIWLWILIAAGLFALNHCELADFRSLKRMASYLIVFLEGLVVTGLYEKDRNLISSLLLHSSINVMAFLK